MAVIPSTDSLRLKLPLILICIGYVASHLPVLAAGLIAPFHVVQLIAVGWAAWAFLVSKQLRRRGRELIKQHGGLLLGLAALVVWAGLSLLWGAYNAVSLYKFVLLGAGVAFGAVTLFLLSSARLRGEQVARLMVYVGLALSVFCIWQFIGDNLNAPHWLTQVIPGGHWDQIDFSRANGLSEEPQFLTTILLLPASLLYFMVTARATRWQWLGFGLLDTALFLSLSRGGFLAHSLLAALWLGYWVSQKKWSLMRWRLAASLAALVITLTLVGWSGSLSGHKGAEWTVRRYIEQASSGLLPLHTDFVQNQNQSAPAINQFDDPQSDNSPEGRDEIGVIEESTVSRLDTYRQGLKIWLANPLNFIFGVGYGSIGNELSERFDEGYTDKGLVNNQSIQIIAELGLIGLGIVIFMMWQIIKLFQLSRSPTTIKLTGAGLLLATALQFQFYSALHLPQLWLVLALGLHLLNNPPNVKVKT